MIRQDQLEKKEKYHRAMIDRMSNIDNYQVPVVGDHNYDRGIPSDEELIAIDLENKRREMIGMGAHAEIVSKKVLNIATSHDIKTQKDFNTLMNGEGSIHTYESNYGESCKK